MQYGELTNQLASINIVLKDSEAALVSARGLGGCVCGCLAVGVSRALTDVPWPMGGSWSS